MCNSFVVYFQIFKTFGYKKLKNSDYIVSLTRFVVKPDNPFILEVNHLSFY